MLLLGFVGSFENGVFFALVLGRSTLDFDFGTGVRGFVEDPGLEDMLEDEVGRVPLGGVGGLPVDGFTGSSADGLEFSRGFRNISSMTSYSRWWCVQ